VRLVYVDIDSLRPSHLGCYGYARRTSPNIDEIASHGVVLTQVYTSDAPCLPSRSTFFGGRFGITTGLVNHGGTNADPRPEGPLRLFQRRAQQRSFGEALRSRGMRVVSLSAFPHRHSAYHVWDGFTEMVDTGGDGLGRADGVYSFAERWLRANGADDNWFLHVNLWDPHTPYDTPVEFGFPFADDAPPAWLSPELIARQRSSFGTRSALKPYGLAPTFTWPRGAPEIDGADTWKAWIDGYDVGIAYADAYVGRIVELLDELGVADETAIVVSADHGENQGELGVYGDHQTADEYTCHVPAVICWPGATDGRAGAEISGLVYSVDLAATMLELCGAAVPEGWHGLSFAHELAGDALTGRGSLVLQQGAWSCQRGARWDRWLLLRTHHTGFKDFAAVMLFDLEADPHETEDVAWKHPEVVLQGLGVIETWVRARLGEARTADPLWNVIAEGGPLHAVEYKPDVCAVLRAHGREDDAAVLEDDDGRPRIWIRTP